MMLSLVLVSEGILRLESYLLTTLQGLSGSPAYDREEDKNAELP